MLGYCQLDPEENAKVFIDENAFANVVCKLAAIFPRQDEVIQSCENIVQHRIHIDGLMQDCSNTIANTLELLQSCTKPVI